MRSSLAFGVSALGAFVTESGVTESGVTEDALLAIVGTFVGALCFLVAALMVLPRNRGAEDAGPH